MSVIKNLLTVSEPIGRLDFFKYSILLVVLMFCVGAICGLIGIPYEVAQFGIVPILFWGELCLLSQRLWSITASKKPAVITGVAVSLCCFIPILGNIIALVAYLAALFVPGKDPVEIEDYYTPEHTDEI